MKKIILFAVSFLCAATTAKAQQADTQAVNTDSVPIEEYVPKVIIEGKWGSNPGEFGVYDEPWAGIDYKPSSLAVDSKGQIYILDFVNERIQKFDANGKYLMSIAVEGFSGKRKEAETTMMVDRDNPDVTVPPDHQRMIEVKRKVIDIKPDFQTIGINIVIDSRDTLYYYLKRIKDGKETGEIWEFRNDKVIKKYFSTRKGGLPPKFQLTPVGYNQFALTVTKPATTPRAHKYRVNVRKEGENSQISVEDNARKIISRIEVPATTEYAVAKAKDGRAKSDVYFEKILDNGNFQVRTVNGGLENISTEEREYTPVGKLVRRVKSPPGYSHGIDVGENGVKVVRWVIQKSN